jgi:hypothetical protein
VPYGVARIRIESAAALSISAWAGGPPSTLCTVNASESEGATRLQGLEPKDRTALGRIRNFQSQLSTAWSHPGNAGHRTKAISRVALFHAKAQVFHQRTCVPIGNHSKMWADRRFAGSVELVLGNPPDWRYMQAWKLSQSNRNPMQERHLKRTPP